LEKCKSNDVLIQSGEYREVTELIWTTGGRLTEIHLIEIVFFQLIEIFIISWPNFLRLFSWLKNSINCQNLQVIFWHLIESFKSTKFHY
jgi:hypothetical protein